MRDSSGEPALFLERTYPNDQYDLYIKDFAKERAETLGLSLYEYDNSSSSGIVLRSDRNIAPYEYEDGGVGVTEGVYRVKAKLIV